MAMSGLPPQYTVTDIITAALTKIERVRGFLEAATLSEDWIRAMGEKALVSEAHCTTHIEGTHLTLDQAKRLLDGQPVPEADPDEARELLNYRRAFEFVSEYLESADPITEGLIREVHRRLVDGVRGGNGLPGQYRKIQNYVINSATGETIYTPPPALAVPALMTELVAWLNGHGQVHPVLASGIAQFQLVNIHPFVDGNGRTSRLLSTLFLYRAGYDFKRLFTISEYYDRDRSAFYSAIQGVRENNMDVTGWLEYFTEGLSTQLTEVKQRGEQVIQRDIMAREHDLSERQTKALGHVLEQGHLTVKEYIVLCPKVNRRTLQRDLKAMVAKGVLIERGTGPTDPTKHYVLD